MQVTSLEGLVKSLSRYDTVAFDLETIGLDPQFHRAGIMCVSFSGEPGKSYVVPYAHPENKMPLNEVRSALNEIFAQDKVWVAHNGKFDCMWLRQFEFTVPEHSHDTIIMAHLLDENQRKNIEAVAARYLGVPGWGHVMQGHFDAISNALRNGKKIPFPPLKELVPYAGRDTDIELQVFRKLWPKLDRGLQRMHDFLMDVSWTLEGIEPVGVYMEGDTLAQLQEEYEERQETMLDTIEEETGTRVNPNSPPQMTSLLFDQLGLKVVEVTDTGNPSAGEHTLKTLRPHAPVVVGSVLEYRKAAKYVGSYLRPWRTLLNDQSRLRSSFNITGTVTGRLSCQNQSPWRGARSIGMSLHQVPRDGEIRRAVSAPEGRLLIVADYSQIELRVAAALADEPRMSEAYRKGEDIHRLTAAAVTGKPLEEVTDEDRQRAKAVNFGFLYGMGSSTFVKMAFDDYDMVFSEAEASALRTSFFRLYRGLRPWHRRTEKFVRRHGFVRTPLGRVRRLPDVHSPEPGIQHSAVRQAINSPVQATASDFTLLAMVLIYDDATFRDLPITVLGQVHDSILLEVREDYAETAANGVKYVMEEEVPREIYRRFGYKFPLPLGAEVIVSKEWGGKPKLVLA